MENSPVKSNKGFAANRERAKNGGLVGGKISRRARNIKQGEPLTSDEMLFLAGGIADILKTEKIEGEKADELVKKASTLLMSGSWDLMFANTLDNPIHSLAMWKNYLIKRWGEAYKLMKEDTATDEDYEWMKSLRNVSEAYNVATNTKTKWVQEAKAHAL